MMLPRSQVDTRVPRLTETSTHSLDVLAQVSQSDIPSRRGLSSPARDSSGYSALQSQS